MNNKLLVIDDDLVLLSLLQMTLMQDYDVLTANSKEAALSILSELDAFPEVVILDLGLPPMPYTPDGGLLLLSQILAMKPNTKVIVLTGQDQEAVSFRALSLGAFDFIVKPASSDQIIAAVKRAFLFLRQQTLTTEQGIHAIQFMVSQNAGLKQVRNEAEKQLFLHVWHQSKENVHETARRLGIKRENVYYLLDKFGVSRADT
ncbi:MAG: response regulator [Gammaproteobacteria bacterium]|nr:response regulator [Gammaproteobacteria bacterium]